MVSRRHLLGAVTGLGLTVGLTGLGGCGGAAPDDTRTEGPGTVAGPVISSFSVLDDMVAGLLGDPARTGTLLGPGMDSHGFEPTASAMAALDQASLLLGIGLGFDDWLGRLAAAGGSGLAPVLLGGRLDGLIMTNGRPDPHVWSGPDSASALIGAAAEALTAALPDERAMIMANLATQRAEAQTALEPARQAFRAAQATDLLVVTPHDSFAYLARWLGVRFAALNDVDDHGHASPARRVGLLEQVAAAGTVVCFHDQTGNRATLQAFADQAGLAVGGTLYGDSLSGPDGPAARWQGLLTHNVGTIAAAFGVE